MPPSPSLPVPNRWRGQWKLRIREVGRERTLGIPFVASVSYNEVEDRFIDGICSSCLDLMFRRSLLAWLLNLTPAVALFVFAGLRHSTLLWLVAGFVAVGTFAFVFYGPFDALLYGSHVLRRIGAPRGRRFEVPANYPTMIVRALVGAVVLFVVAAVVAT